MGIELHFICPCGAVVEGSIDDAGPHTAADAVGGSERDWWSVLVCDACTKDFEVHVSNANGHTYVEVPGAVDLSWDSSTLEYEDELVWEIKYTEQLAHYKKVASDVICLLSSDFPTKAAYTFYSMLYAQVVTAVEAYLSGVFIHHVLNSDALLKSLVESDPELAKRKFSLSDIFTQWSNLKLEVAKYLKDMVFHDLKRVKPMYRDVLGYKFLDIE